MTLINLQLNHKIPIYQNSVTCYNVLTIKYILIKIKIKLLRSYSLTYLVQSNFFTLV